MSDEARATSIVRKLTREEWFAEYDALSAKREARERASEQTESAANEGEGTL